MKKLFTTVLLAIISASFLPAVAETVQYKDETSGIVYLIDTAKQEAGVYSAASVSGTLAVPDAMTYEGKSYKVTSICDDAFITNKKITRLETGLNLKKIGANAFKNCTTITFAVMTGIEQIGASAFSGCTALGGMDLASDNLTVIGNEAFSGCTLLKGEFEIPESVTTIGENPWHGCSAITSIAAPAGSDKWVTSDGVLYTKDMKTLLAYPCGKENTSFSVPATVETLAGSSLRGAAFTSITLPSKLVTLGKMCMYRSQLTSLEIPASVKTIEMMAFTRSAGLKNITVASGNTSFKYSDGYFTSADGKRLIFSQPRTDELTIPEGIETVDDYTFFEMGITALTLPSSMRVLGELAFYNCASLKSIDFSTGIHTISRMCFQNCKALTSVKLPASMRTLGLQAFTYDEKISTLTLNEGLERMDNSVFLGCKAIRRVTIPSTLKQMGAALFYQCNRLMTVTFSDGLTVVPDQMFNYDSNLYNVTLPNSIRTIERAAFYGNALKEDSFKWPEELDSIGFTAFFKTKFTKLELPAKLRHIGEWAFSNMPDLQTVVLGKGTKVIDEYAFTTNNKLESITLNEGLEKIGEKAITACPMLTSLAIPATVTTYGAYALALNPNLKNLVVMSKTPATLSKDIVDEQEYSKITLHVTEDALAAYKSAPFWSKFTNIKGDAAGVDSIQTEEPEVTAVYTIDGLPAGADAKGLLIKRYSNGTTKKVYVK